MPRIQKTFRGIDLINVTCFINSLQVQTKNPYLSLWVTQLALIKAANLANSSNDQQIGCQEVFDFVSQISDILSGFLIYFSSSHEPRPNQVLISCWWVELTENVT